MRKVGTLIVGAGPCGLGAAKRLSELGDDQWLLVERSCHVGGHARSVEDDAGFVWDIGGHVQYARSAAYSSLLERLFPEGMHQVLRNSSAYQDGYFVPYPYQLNLAALPPPERDAALRDLTAAARALTEDGRNYQRNRFGDWLAARYGATIYESFMLPYNEKCWSLHPNEMGTFWIRGFLADVDIEEVTRNVRTGRLTTDWGYNATFSYPKRGGCGEIWRRLGAELKQTGRLTLGVGVQAIDPGARRVTLGNGEIVGYDHLVTTMPLTKLCAMIGDAEAAALGAQLHASQLLAVGIGVNGPLPDMLTGRSWIYVASPDCPFHRVTDRTVELRGVQRSLSR